MDIKGYRVLSDNEIALINRIKAVGEQVRVLLEDELVSVSGLDTRWLAIGKTDLQKGFMALVRAVAKPEGF